LSWPRRDPPHQGGAQSRTAPRAIAWLALAALAAVVLGCGGAGGDAGAAASARGASGELSVYVDSYPLSYFAQRVGGDRVAVSFPIPSGVDPQFWTPDASLIARYQEADLILVNGAGYAAWVDTATLPGSRLVDTSIGFADRLLPLENAVTHSHGGMGEHSHAGYATMPWLDPMLAAEQAAEIAAAFSSARPENAAAFADGLAALRRDLEALDARLAAVAGRIGAAPLVFSHPVYSYLARRYGLNGRSLHFDPAEVPGYFALAQLDEKLAGHPAQWMVWEAEPLAETRAELERRGIRSLVFDPLASAPASGDYLSAMGENVARLEAAFPAG
jgi:zinc transport system substrate-binding protein